MVVLVRTTKLDTHTPFQRTDNADRPAAVCGRTYQDTQAVFGSPQHPVYSSSPGWIVKPFAMVSDKRHDEVLEGVPFMKSFPSCIGTGVPLAYPGDARREDRSEHNQPGHSAIRELQRKLR